MAIRKILKTAHAEDREILSTVSKRIMDFDQRLSILIDDMIDTMISANGCGLAAPQVGILKRVFVICVDGETMYEFVNPIIIKTFGIQCEPEGCLSMPGLNGIVERPKKLIVKAQDRTGKEFELKVDGLFARAVCHENDHLDGILFESKIMQTEEMIAK